VKLSLARETLATIATSAIDAAALGYSVGVVDHLPDAIAPPVVLVAWSDPWLKPGTFCAWASALELLVVAQRLEPGGQVTTLEEIVSALIPALKSSGEFVVVDATSPYPLQLGGVDYLAASINITHDIGE